MAGRSAHQIYTLEEVQLWDSRAEFNSDTTLFGAKLRLGSPLKEKNETQRTVTVSARQSQKRLNDRIARSNSEITLSRPQVKVWITHTNQTEIKISLEGGIYPKSPKFTSRYQTGNKTKQKRHY